MAAEKLGVEGRPLKVGDETRFAALDVVAYIEPGRARRDGERPGGCGDDERGGWPVPVYFFWVNVSEKMACERDDWAFMSVSFVRRMAVPFLRSLQAVSGKISKVARRRTP